MGWFQNILGGNQGTSGHREATTVDILGKPLRCNVCGYHYFWRHDVTLTFNTRGSGVCNPEWLNNGATCAVCDQCGFIHWFMPQGGETEERGE